MDDNGILIHYMLLCIAVCTSGSHTLSLGLLTIIGMNSIMCGPTILDLTLVLDTLCFRLQRMFRSNIVDLTVANNIDLGNHYRLYRHNPCPTFHTLTVFGRARE